MQEEPNHIEERYER